MPRRGAVLPSLGGSRISTERTVGWRHVEQPRGPRPARPTDGRARRRHLRAGIAEIQAELEVSPEFPPEVEAAAAAAVANPRLPDLDRTDLPMVTIDPPGSMDLDQALHLARDDGGYVLYYAIADLAAFITPGDPVDVEAHPRGQTLYGADSRIPLHPTSLSEDGGSLLPDQVRPSLLWTIRLDGEGSRTDVEVERALVKSRAQLDYPEAQKPIDDGTAGRAPDAAQGGRAAPAHARGGPRRHLAAAARAGGRHRRVGVGARATATCCRSRSGTPRCRCSPASPRRR